MFHLTSLEHILSLFGEYACLCILITFTLSTLIIPYPKTCIKNYTTLNNLNFIKILLTFGIVLHHIFNYLGIWNRADICVEFFFIISGFLLVYTNSFQQTFKSFTFSRIIRFIPYIFFANLLSLFGKEYIDWPRFFSGIFLFSTTPLYPHHTYYMPAWYLVILLWVAVFYFAVTKIFGKRADCVIGAITLISGISLHYHPGLIEDFNPLIPCLTNGMLRGLSCIGIGYFMTIIYKHNKNILFKNKFLFTLFELLLLIGLPLTLFWKPCEINIEWELLGFVLLFDLFLLKRGLISLFFEHPIWLKMAKFTLPIYMTHDVIIPVMIYGSNILTPSSLVTKVFILLVLATIFGIFTYYMFYMASILHKKIYIKKNP